MGNNNKEWVISFARHLIEMPNHKLESKSLGEHYDEFINSQSPTIDQPDFHSSTIHKQAEKFNSQFHTLQQAMEINRNQTLQEGDWFEGTEEDYRKAFDIFGVLVPELASYNATKQGYASVIKYRDGKIGLTFGEKKTKITPEEFLRRAENTFKTK